MVAAVEDVMRRLSQARKRPLLVLVSRFIDDEVTAEIYKWRRLIKATCSATDELDVLLHSPGGDLAACYQIARLLSRYTDGWQALVPRMAASGATLISLGSETIVMADLAQLGPLDPQVISKRHGKFFAIERQSPLEAFQAVKYLREYSLTSLDAFMAFLIEHMVAPQPSLETASRLAVQIVQPILDKIEPYDLGALALDSNLAKNYCRRICHPTDPGKKAQRDAKYVSLVETYPAHEFVIDRWEAENIGLVVDEPSDEVDDLFDEIADTLESVHNFVGFVY
jgi:hypothetical protein